VPVRKPGKASLTVSLAMLGLSNKESGCLLTSFDVNENVFRNNYFII
jgi:hypothetical protein